MKISYRRLEKIGCYTYQVVRYSNGHYGIEGLEQTFKMLGQLRRFLLSEQD